MVTTTKRDDLRTMADVRKAFPEHFEGYHPRDFGYQFGTKLYDGMYFVQSYVIPYEPEQHGQNRETFLWQDPMKMETCLVTCVRKYVLCQVTVERGIETMGWMPTFWTMSGALRCLKRLLPPPPAKVGKPRFERI